MTSKSTPKTAQESIYTVIRRTGGRMTIPMRAVVSILLNSDRHPTADDLIVEVERRIPSIAPSTIYRVLSRLNELDIIEHVHSGTGPAFYQLHDSSHVHLVCNGCGTIINIPEQAFQQLSRDVLETYEFVVEPRHAALLGQCSRCSTAEDPLPRTQHGHDHHSHAGAASATERP
jgi:Fe2+ or Zn2+ uptake regulation protein